MTVEQITALAFQAFGKVVYNEGTYPAKEIAALTDEELQIFNNEWYAYFGMTNIEACSVIDDDNDDESPF
jgi:hypothetical protein